MLKKNMDVAMRKMIVVSGLLSLVPAVCSGAQERVTTPAPQVGAIAAPAQNEDMLVFWEEKELYVQTATRTEKPIFHTAENMTVITAKQIEDMNAHTVAEVLNRVPGLFVDFSTNDFGSTALLHVQGSETRHVTVLLDGVVWNFLAEGNAETSSIPVRIIDRIEIVKGPASSAWGSALGGVINIITKSVGDTKIPKGIVSGSYGERNTQDHNGELFGKTGFAGYYLYAGRQESDGLRNSRDFSRNSFYGKVSLTPSRDWDLVFTAGYADPLQNSSDVPAADITSKTKISSLHVTGALDYRLTPEWTLKGTLYLFRQKVDLPNYFLSSGDLFKDILFEEETVGGSIRATYSSGMHSAVVGVDASRGTLDQTTKVGPLLQGFGVPASATVSPSINKWALFANDTVDFGPVTVTPGLRLDHNNISGYFVSPSIGATWEIAEHTVMRASVARGFTSPPLSFTSGGGIFFVPNSSLSEESGWSYQVGGESGVSDYLHVKGTLFRHDTDNEMLVEPVVGNPPNKTVNNRGDVTRQGYELEGETVPLYNLSLKLGHAYVHKKAESQPDGTDNYSWHVGIKYDDRRSLMAQLSGTYVWWDLPAGSNARYDNFIWDLNLNKKFRLPKENVLETFLTVHNLFGGSYYTLGIYPNPSRWVEGGLRLRF